MLTTNQKLQQGRYRIVNQLGQNGIGIGYEAFDTVLETNVLLKEIRDNLGKSTTPAQVEASKINFAGKAKILTEIKHESLLHVKDFFSETDHHYLVTEFIDGTTLGELLEKKKSPFPLADASSWADSLLDALNYLHTLTPQIIHREVKPQNVRLSPNGKIKLLVFNIVKSDDDNADGANESQTFDAAVLPYLPLEQIWGGLDAASQKVILTNFDDKSEKILQQDPDSRSDIYALGATLYHLLTARIPADALTRSIEILEGKADPLQSPSEINPSVPTEISEVLIKALEIKREERYSSAAIMRQVLRTAFVRVKEREAKKANSVKMEDDAVLEIPVVKAKPAAPPVVHKKPEIESEHMRQLELIKKQLREAEMRRLEAEQRASQAEQRLLEKEAEKPVGAGSRSETNNGFAAQENSSDEEFSSLFAEPEKENNSFKKIAAAGVAVVVLGGAAFGIWSVTQSKPADPTQSSSSTNSAITAPAAETTPVSNSLATTDTNTAPTNPTSTEPAPPISNPVAVKAKITATPTPPPVKQPKATPVKTDATKKVTLDELLKDN